MCFLYFLVQIKLNYFDFRAFDIEEKATEIFKYIIPFSREKHGQE